MSNNRFYDNLNGFSDITYENGKLYGRQNGGAYQEIPTRGADGADGQDGADGSDGVSTYVYRAFAADASGATGFSLIDSPELQYEALLVTHTEIISPTLADFANCTWKKIVGDNGTNGTNGTNGHDCYTYVAWAADAQATSGISMTPTANLPYRAELHTDHVIASPSLSDFSGVPFVNIGGGTTYTFTSPLVESGGTVSIDLADYAKKDLSNLTAHTAIDTTAPVDYVICRHTDSSTGAFVRIWKSGWVEQGGNATPAASSAGATVTFPVSFADTNYKVQLTIGIANPDNTGARVAVQNTQLKTSASMNFRVTKNTSYIAYATDWYVCGQGLATGTGSIAEYLEDHPM